MRELGLGIGVQGLEEDKARGFALKNCNSATGAQGMRACCAEDAIICVFPAPADFELLSTP